MTYIDYSIFLAYLCGVTAMGIFLSGRDKSSDNFFLAGRTMHWLPIGLSIMVTMFSAVNYVALTGEVFLNGLYVTVALPVFILIAFPVTKIIIPFFHDMRLTSAYEFLERRFDNRARKLACVMFLLWRIAWMAIALFASGKILHAITSIPLPLIIVLAGVTATAYASSGGMKAVMWTDTLQFFILFGGIVLLIILAINDSPGGLWGIMETAHKNDLLKPLMPFDWSFLSFDPRIRISLWSGLIGVSVAFLARYSSDQVVVQRYFSARSLKEAQCGFWLNSISAVVVLSLLALLGIVLFSHAKLSGTLNQQLPPVKYLADMIKTLPIGVCGLISAGLMAATMSSIDSGVNSCTASFTTDLCNISNESASVIKIRKVTSVSLGALSIILALAIIPMTKGDKTIFVIINKVINGLGSPLLAIMLLAIFSSKVNSCGIFYGGATGAVISIVVSLFLKGVALHYYAVINLAATLATCYAFTLLCKNSTNNNDLSLTWKNWKK